VRGRKSAARICPYSLSATDNPAEHCCDCTVPRFLRTISEVCSGGNGSLIERWLVIGSHEPTTICSQLVSGTAGLVDGIKVGIKLAPSVRGPAQGPRGAGLACDGLPVPGFPVQGRAGWPVSPPYPTASAHVTTPVAPPPLRRPVERALR
jgi:hypothetical protein